MPAEPDALSLQAAAPGRPGAAELREVVCAETVRLTVEGFRSGLCAIVLTGSLARDEATVVPEDGLQRVLGDAEFLLVYRESSALPNEAQVARLSSSVEAALCQHQIHCHIGLSVVLPHFFRRLKPHIFAYELSKWGVVAWGDVGILTLIPPFTPSDIPLEDGWRLLCNRMVELLEVSVHLPETPAVLPTDVFYRTAKLCLDMGTSFLLFEGAYEPAYRLRADRLRALAESSATVGCYPVFLRTLSNLVGACTRLKLGEVPGFGQEELGMPFLLEAVRHAHLLWRWELEELTRTAEHVSDDELFRRWMRLQPLASRFRGWAVVLRACGWQRSWRHWGRWGWLAWQASPRYWTYKAASELLFNLPDLPLGRPSNAGKEAQWQHLRPTLAQVDPSADQLEPAWRRLASDVAWNYAKFLVGTRA